MKAAGSGLIVVAVAVVIASVPVPEGVTPQAWHLLAIFAATIAGLILRPLPAGAMVFLGVAALAVLGIVPYREVLTGFANATVWLIVVAFLFARAFLLTGLGRRIAFLLIRSFGKRTLGLAYSLALADLLMAPVVPSNTARAGGVLYPIVRSLAGALGSEPGATARRAGAFLILSGYQCTIVTSAMFMTAMAANALAAEMAAEIAGAVLSWGTWALGAALPGLLSLALVPLVLFKLHPPEIRRTPEAAELAHRALREMGPMSRREKVLLGVFAVVVALWATSPLHSMSATTVALTGLSSLLVLAVMTWQDVLEERGAWDALIWFGGLVMMAGQLDEQGIVGWFADNVSGLVTAWPWVLALLVLLLVYLYAHYGFASMTAHVTAMYPAFLAVAVATGAPPVLAALALAYFSNLNASLTHYGTGPAPIYFGAGYVELGAWWRLGFVVSVVNTLVWVGIGFPYWWILGLW